MDENSDTREIPAATPWDQPPPPRDDGGAPWGSPPPAKLVSGGGRRPARRGRIGLVLLLVGLVGLVGVVAVLAVAGLMVLQASDYGGGSGLSNYSRYVEEEGEGDDRILMIRIEGVISSSEGCAPAAIAQLRKLRKENEPENVKVVLLRVDSPGGSVTPCDVIDNEITKLKAEKGIKVVSFYDGVAASGGYYVSARSDHIVARPTCVTGSIGVITLAINAQKLLEDKLGIEAQAITSVPFKDVPSLFRPMKEEERAYMEKFITDAHARFLGIVREGRRLSDEEVAAFADGRVFLSEDALRLKMIDEIGHWDEAIAAARREAGSKAPIIGYRRKPNPFELMLQTKKSSELPEDLKLKLEIAARNRFCYLWLP